MYVQDELEENDEERGRVVRPGKASKPACSFGVTRLSQADPDHLARSISLSFFLTVIVVPHVSNAEGLRPPWLGYVFIY